MSAYPNPSNGPVYLVYTVPEGVENVELNMHDAQGRLVHSSRPQPRNGIVEVLAKDLSSVVHLVSHRYDGIQVATAKVSVSK